MSGHATPITDAAIAAAGSKATYTGAGMTISGWFLSSEFAVLVGIVIGVAGFAVNWYYRHKEDARQQAEHERRMRGFNEDSK
jgi:hypothetical protein